MTKISTSTELLIVAGFSCAGKSQYIRQIVTENPKFKNATLVFQYMFRKPTQKSLKPGDVFHLDLSFGNNAWKGEELLYEHLMFNRLVGLSFPVTVDFLVASPPEIYSRISQRSHIGIGWREDNLVGKYPRNKKLKMLEATELSKRYDLWRKLFEKNGYHCRYFHSHDGEFIRLSDWSKAEAILKTSKHE